MSEWDKLWVNEIDPELTGARIYPVSWIKNVKAEGDRLNEKADLFDQLFGDISVEIVSKEWLDGKLEKAENWDKSSWLDKQIYEANRRMGNKLEAIKIDEWFNEFKGDKYDILFDYYGYVSAFRDFIKEKLNALEVKE